MQIFMIFITWYFWVHGGQDEYIALDFSASYAEKSNAMYSSCPPWTQKYHVMNIMNILFFVIGWCWSIIDAKCYACCWKFKNDQWQIWDRTFYLLTLFMDDQIEILCPGGNVLSKVSRISRNPIFILNVVVPQNASRKTLNKFKCCKEI